MTHIYKLIFIRFRYLLSTIYKKGEYGGKLKNIIIAQDRYSILGGISTVNKLLGRAFDEAGYNVSYMALFDNTAGHPDAIEPILWLIWVLW